MKDNHILVVGSDERNEEMLQEADRQRAEYKAHAFWYTLMTALFYWMLRVDLGLPFLIPQFGLDPWWGMLVITIGTVVLLHLATVKAEPPTFFAPHALNLCFRFSWLVALLSSTVVTGVFLHDRGQSGVSMIVVPLALLAVFMGTLYRTVFSRFTEGYVRYSFPCLIASWCVFATVILGPLWSLINGVALGFVAAVLQTVATYQSRSAGRDA